MKLTFFEEPLLEFANDVRDLSSANHPARIASFSARLFGSGSGCDCTAGMRSSLSAERRQKDQPPLPSTNCLSGRGAQRTDSLDRGSVAFIEHMVIRICPRQYGLC